MVRRLSSLAAAMLITSVTAAAFADLPPPPGQTRVDYSFEVDRPVEGTAIVAFPSHDGKDPNNVVVMEPATPLRPFKGWTPGLYLVPKAEVASIPKGDQEAAKTWLAAHAKVCLKQVPRIYQIESETTVDKVNDVIHLEAKSDRCEASLVKSVYTTADGKTVQGGVDASGNRTAPAPIGKGLPSVREAGFAAFTGSTEPGPSASPASPASSASPTVAPSSPAAGSSSSPAAPQAPSSGCAGCTLSERAAQGGSLAMAAMVAAVLAWRRRATTAAVRQRQPRR